MIQMIGGAFIEIDTGSFQNDMTNIKSRDDVLTLLVHLGYLAYDSTAKAVFIPNEEVRQEFLLAVKNGRHKEVAKLIRNSDRLLEQTLNMEETAVAEAIEKAHSMGTSPQVNFSLFSTVNDGYSYIALHSAHKTMDNSGQIVGKVL